MNFNLPKYQGLPVQLLAATFKKTAATYKFYWFLSLLQLVEEEGAMIEKQFNPEGFNVGINIGVHAVQTVSHAHIHLIPRYAGDVEDPSGGVRGVIPDKKNYL